KIVIPSLDHLSSGQSIIFNLFTTVIRYADIGDVNKSFHLDQIEGIVVIDEIDAHLDSQLQYEILPKMIKLFPKVQFIVTTHSPLFLLGMEKNYDVDGFRIIEMPNGKAISTERFSEFHTSFEYYKMTKNYEESIQKRMLESTKPLVLTEGETDPIYITTSLNILNRKDLIDRLDIEWVGGQHERGKSYNTGQNGLNNTRRVFEANPDLLKNKLLLLYDSDTGKPNEDLGQISIRCIPKNKTNTKFKKGIENLLPPNLEDAYPEGSEAYYKRFYPENVDVGDYGEPRRTTSFNKMEFCKWICEERLDESDFTIFSDIIVILEKFLNK
ncbi:AAA family ATPase, partial [Vibrio sp.]|uniref:AAA family ATPase n=1 Tax=Vibrio sp. TaxID=678 RepID=UPI003D0EE2DB